MLNLRNRDFSRDPAAVQAMDDDPLVAREVQPAHTVAELLAGAERLDREFERFGLPVLILHGTEDRVTRPIGSRTFYARAGSRDKTLRLYEGHAHDLFNDLDRGRVLDEVGDWLEAHLAGAARHDDAGPRERRGAHLGPGIGLVDPPTAPM